jgi:hypothetical protein
MTRSNSAYCSERRPLGATRGEMYVNARSVLDHSRADLDRALPYGCELGLGQRVVCGIAARTPCIT